MRKKTNDITGIILGLTMKGRMFAELSSDQDFAWKEENPRLDFLIALEEDYFNAEGGIDDIFNKCRIKYHKLYETELQLTKKEFTELFTENLIGIRKITWTNVQGGDLE